MAENEEKILFWQGGEGFELFSNFSIYPIMYKGILWPTAEHAYQAEKFENERIKNEILNAKTPKDAFDIGRDPKNILRKDWFEIRVKVMEDIVREKIKQNPLIHEKLIETGDKEIIEASPIDSFWGWGPDKKEKIIWVKFG